MNVLIIEDERPNAKALERMILEVRPETNIIGVTTNISDSISIIEANHNLDIIFSDIMIDDGYSFLVFDKVCTNAMIVFTTAYDEYALRAFDYNCVDYLLKPISCPALERAFCKYETRKPSMEIDIIRSLAAQIKNPVASCRKRLLLVLGRDTIVCSIEQISYIYTEQGVVKVFLSNGQFGLVEESLTDLATSLPSDMFFRANRQTIINIGQITKLTKGDGRESAITLADPFSHEHITITQERKKRLIELLSR